ncbi:cell division protein FtsZ [Palleronia marisminoris]|uniref:Cell division protein FtsZ n=1 Tax=Palleronia marisminoris TaxID=315423 RepID=A0A1Y5RQQ2_9RHOB|nr:cell division protein FtsZ [Palleronia marisminoris]SFG54273.1 cell division protein FtsZ [Palleronia marisminoris]SLN23103.1 Cell division protein FtsZ [Palleronia marisminoris]
MTLNLTMASQHDELKPRITVFGVGGAGGNAVNNMIAKQLEGVEFVVANTDAQALSQSSAPNRVQMGVKVTEGLGAGAKAHIGAAAAEESIEEIVDHLAGAHMCFITAGMGGGTGTGATPIIAQAARELGVLTVGVVTKPFQFEGPRRMRQAEEGIEALQKMVDTLIIIPNQNLFRLANEKTTCTDAFSIADDVLYQGVKGVTDLMVRPGLINLDFADVRAVMDEMGKAMMGTGEAEGEDRAPQAAEKAIANPLLDEVSLHGARGVLINVTGGEDLTLYELDEAANVIREKVDPDANIIVGSTLDPDMNGKMRVSVVATGIDASHDVGETPMPRRSMAQPIARKEQQPVEDEEAMSLFEDRPADAPEQPQIAASTRPQTTRPAPSDVVDEDDDFFGDWERARREREAPAAQPQRSQARTGQGQPSPEVMERLEAATRRTPDAPRPTAPQRPAAPAATPRAAEPRPAAPVEKPRFGINSLINRMGGQDSASGHEGGSERATAAAAARRRTPPMPRYEEEAEQSNEDRIEIPAFLRRQAN